MAARLGTSPGRFWSNGDAALPPDDHGWQEVTLQFEHELAAAHRLAGFGADVQVLSPPAVREQLLATARGILGRYGAVDGPGLGGPI